MGSKITSCCYAMLLFTACYYWWSLLLLRTSGIWSRWYFTDNNGVRSLYWIYILTQVNNRNKHKWNYNNQSKTASSKLFPYSSAKISTKNTTTTIIIMMIQYKQQAAAYQRSGKQDMSQVSMRTSKLLLHTVVHERTLGLRKQTLKCLYVSVTIVCLSSNISNTRLLVQQQSCRANGLLLYHWRKRCCWWY